MTAAVAVTRKKARLNAQLTLLFGQQILELGDELSAVSLGAVLFVVRKIHCAQNQLYPK